MTTTTAIAGNKVSVHYVGTLDDGTVFDNSRTNGTPITFELGKGQVIPGFEASVTGMAVGETKTVSLDPEQAYGISHEELLTSVPHSSFPEDTNLYVGITVEGKSSDGQLMSARVTSIEEDHVVLDFNHPMAGRTLNFDLELVSIDDTSPRE